MCGILGATLENNIKISASQREAIQQALSHRGPDGSQVLVFGRSILGHNRLSIIDLSKEANQPMQHESEPVYIVFNGEIYNFRALAQKYLNKSRSKYKSDTRVLLDLYVNYGIEKFNELKGIFAFAIVDMRIGVTILCRDHFGVKPLVYLKQGRELYFASEAKGIMAIRNESYSLNIATFENYVTTGQVSYKGQTFFKGISELEPGTVMIYNHNEGNLKKQQYFDLEESVLEKQQTRNLEKNVYDLFEVSLKSNLTSDVPIALGLSAGLDSMSILKTGESRISEIKHTFSYGFGDSKYDESSAAHELSYKYGVPNTKVIFGQDEVEKYLPEATRLFETPLGGIGTFGLYIMCKSAASSGFKVILTGEGSDEIFGGYDYYFSGFFHDIRNPIRKILFLKRFAAKRKIGILSAYRKLSENVGNQSLAPDGTSTFMFAAEGKESGFHDKFDLKYGNQLTKAQILQITDLKFRKIPKLLHFLDRSGASNGVEARVPFLDKDLVTTTLALAGRYHYSNGLGKEVLRRSILGLNSKGVRDLKKWVATPQREWLQDSLGQWGHDLYHDGLLKRSGLVEGDKLEKAIRLYRDSDTTPLNSFFFWQAINLELLFRAYPSLI